MCHSAQAVTEAVAITILINAIAQITYLGNFGGWSALNNSVFFGYEKKLISTTEKFLIPHPVNLSYPILSYPIPSSICNSKLSLAFFYSSSLTPWLNNVVRWLI